MMKKFIFLILALPAICYAGTLQNMQSVLSMYNAAAITPCPAFYADTNVVFSWDGDHSSGTNYGCDSGGNPIQGTNTGLTISTSYGESSSNGALINNVNQRLAWVDTGDQYVDDVGPQTIWARIYISVLPTSENVCFFEANQGSSNNLLSYELKSVTNAMNGVYIGNGTADTVNGNLPSTGVWINVGYSWDYSGDRLSAYNGSSWDPETSEGLVAMSANLTAFMIGELYRITNDDSTGVIWVDRIALVDGWEAAIPTNW